MVLLTKVWPPDRATMSLSFRPMREKISLKCDAPEIFFHISMNFPNNCESRQTHAMAK